MTKHKNPRRHAGKPRACMKCKTTFTPCARFPEARQCAPCRDASEATRRHVARTRPAPPPPGHTHAWDSASLAVLEAAHLRMAWRPAPGNSVTGNSE